jgi:hypothetical protein
VHNQDKIVKQWKAFSNTEAFEDLIQYIDSQREMFRQYSEDMSIPHPKKSDEVISLDSQAIANLLQTSRGLRIVKTYIQSRVDMDVAQPTKSK